MVMNIEVRDVKLGELEEVVKITNDAFNVPYQKDEYELKYNEPPEKLVEEFKSGKTKVVVAVLDNKIVGAQRYADAGSKFAPYNKEGVEIKKLAVLKEFRNQGVGERLIKETEKKIRDSGRSIIVLECVLEKNLAPHYKNLGFQEYRTVEHGDHHDVYMFKKLF